MAGELKTVSPEDAALNSDIPEEIVVKVKNIFASALNKDASEITETAHFFYDLGGTSLDFLSVLSAVQNEFGVVISAEAEASFATVTDFCCYIRDNVL